MMKDILLKIRKIVEYFVYLILIAMTLIICWQVVSRFLMGITPSWSQELSLLLLVWSAFLGIALGVQDNSHIYISLFTKTLPSKVQSVLHIMNRILAILFGLFMTIEGGRFARDMASSTISGIKVPSSIVYLPVPIAGGLIVIYLVAELLGQWTPLEENEKGVDE